MKNQNTKIIVKRILTFFMLICLIKIVDAQEQSCRTWLKSARDYRAEGKYNEAINMYNKVIKQCPDYNNIVANELKECQSKLKGNSNKTNPKKTSGGYVPQEQQESGRVIYEDMIEAKGCDSYDVRVTCEGDWFPTINEDWLEIVSQSGNVLVLKCYPNPNREDRYAKIGIVCDGRGGSSTQTITVKQAGRSSSKNTARTNNTPETNEDISITVKVTFETRKAKPTFDNTGNIIELLELLNNNNNLGLQIETPWCSNQKSIKIIPKYPMSLIDNRINNIKDHFTTLGIAKERISSSIKPIDVEEGNKECDCGYVRIIDIGDESSK